jgi:hypothetical protein
VLTPAFVSANADLAPAAAKQKMIFSYSAAFTLATIKVPRTLPERVLISRFTSSEI